ncbi:ATP-binding cassette domain-containing protein [Nocardioides sp.]|uniref:ABC transporter ATP-binding protein n=1 Tax=Nocardioides sp. TaxID=35761 RepID=UPI002621865C|nr:ATP-binding cassette domain-containing protein [Nocardioides sp.]
MVDVEVGPGSIVGMVGPNGAGKSTLFNCLTGVVSPDAGTVELDGKDITRWPTERRARVGIGRTFQTARADPNSTVCDAIMTGFTVSTRQCMLGAFLSSPGVRAEEKQFKARALALVDTFDLGNPDALVGELPAPHRRLLEVARTLAGDAKYLLLDEPAAGMDSLDRQILSKVLRQVADRGIGIVLVEHNFGFVLSLCDEVTVLASGKVVAQGTPEHIREHPEIVRVYLGQGTP